MKTRYDDGPDAVIFEDDKPIDAEAGARRDMFHAEYPKYQGDDNEFME